MPSSITHAYIAKDVYQVLDKKIKAKISKDHLEDYKTYSQGADIYYFYKMLTPFTKKSYEVRTFGRTCHAEKTNEVFINLTEKVKETKDFNQFLFLIGLMTHYNADSIIHPYINYKASLMNKKYFDGRDAHFLLETYLDNYMIKKRDTINYKTFKVHEFCFNLEKHDSVEVLLNQTFLEEFDIKNLGNYYFKGAKDMKKFFKYLRYDPNGYKRDIYKLLNFITRRCFRDVRYLSYNFDLLEDDKYLNLNHESWYNTDGDKNKLYNDSFLDLYSKVVSKTKEMIEVLYNYVFENKDVDLEKLFGNKSYGTGLPLK